MSEDTLAAPYVEHRKKQEQDELLERIHCWLDWPLTALGIVMLVLLLVDLLASTDTIHLTAIIAAYLLGQRSEEQEARARIDNDELALLRQEIARLQALVEARLPAPTPAPEGED